MKTQLLLTLLLGFALRLEAQHFQIVDQTDFDNRVTVTAPIPGGEFYAAVQAGEPGLEYSQCRILKYDPTGNEKWRLELPGSGQDVANDLLVLPDSSVLVCGSNKFCGLADFGFLARIGADGVLKWHVYQDFNNPVPPIEFDPVQTMTIDDTGNVWVYTFSYLHGFDLETGEYLITHEIPQLDFSEYTDIYFNPIYQRFYVVGNVGVHWVDPLTGNLQTVAYLQHSDGPFLEIIPLNDSTMMTYSEDGEVVVFTADSTVNAIDWSSHSSEYVALNNDGLLAVYGSGKLLVYGPDFQLQQQFEPWLGGLTVNDLNWSNNRILLSGEEAHTSDVQFRNTAAWAQSYDPDGQTFNSVMEAEILEVIKIQQPVATLVFGWNVDYSVTQGAFDVRVRNLSFATLDTLTIYSAYYGNDGVAIDCPPLSSRINVTFTGLNLGPGQEIILPIGLVESPHVPINRINPWTVCMWVGNPNGQTDTNHSNNLACVGVYPTVGTKEPEAVAFELFPNPATHACTITWGENLRPETVQVYDVYSRLLLTETLNTFSGMHDLQLAALPSGVYTVVLEKVVQRVIKQ